MFVDVVFGPKLGGGRTPSHAGQLQVKVQNERDEREGRNQQLSAMGAPKPRWGGRPRDRVRVYFHGVALPGWKLSECRSGVLLISHTPELGSIATQDLSWFSGFRVWLF